MIEVCKMNVITIRTDYGQRHSSFLKLLSRCTPKLSVG